MPEKACQIQRRDPILSITYHENGRQGEEVEKVRPSCSMLEKSVTVNVKICRNFLEE